VTIKTFIDDLSIHGVEKGLMRQLPSLFGPDIVYNLSDEEIWSLAAEAPEAAKVRSHYTAKLGVLESALHDLKRLRSAHPELRGMSSFIQIPI
jgi:hypothetical protein